MALSTKPYGGQLVENVSQAMSRELDKHMAHAFLYGGAKSGRWVPPKNVEQQMAENEEFRFRSFAERFVIARAEGFRTGHVDEDAWAATLEAKSAYSRIAEVAKGYREAPTQESAGQQAQSVYAPLPAPTQKVRTVLPVQQSKLWGMLGGIGKKVP